MRWYCSDNVVGASGGVYALIALWLADLILNYAELPLLWLRVPLLALFIVGNAALSVSA